MEDKLRSIAPAPELKLEKIVAQYVLEMLFNEKSPLMAYNVINKFRDKYTDIVIRLVDEVDDTKMLMMKLHRIVLILTCPYFEAMLTRFKESQDQVIIIKVPNISAAHDVIMSFYGQVTNVGNLPEPLHQLEMTRCYLYFGLEIDTDTLPAIPPSAIDNLFELIEQVGYNSKTIRLLYQNIPDDYVLEKTVISKIRDLSQEIYLITSVNDNTIMAWHERTHRPVTLAQCDHGHNVSMTMVTVSADHTYVGYLTSDHRMYITTVIILSRISIDRHTYT